MMSLIGSGLVKFLKVNPIVKQTLAFVPTWPFGVVGT